MARSPKDDPRFSDIQHNNTWNFRKESIDNCAHGGLNDRNQHTMSPNSSVMTDNSVYINPNFSGDIYHMNKLPYTGDAVASKDNNVSYNDMANANRVNRQNYGNAMLNLGNGQLVRVYYDENNKQLIFPVSNQYELFKHNQGIIDSPAQAAPSHLFTINQEYSSNTNNIHMQPSTATMQSNSYNNQDNVNQTSVPTSNFLNEVLGNWEPNSTGTYSPFGQNYPLNHPDAPALSILSNNIPEAIVAPTVKIDASPKRNENSPLADTSSKKRIVAEVKPMRPSYSDVLAKNTKNNVHPDTSRIAKPQVSPDVKSTSSKANSKQDKPINNIKHLNDESKQKNEKKHSTISSGSESGDFIGDDTEKRQKPNKKLKKNMTQRWSSFDDVANEENSKFNDGQSQFMFIEKQSEKFTKKEKKFEKNKSFEKSFEDLDDFKFEENDEPQFIVQDNPADLSKSKKKKDGRNHHKTAKPLQDKKKSAQSKLRKHKPGYLGLAQGYLEHWGEATWKAFIWFFYLLSDICGMSLHLSFDLCTSAFTQTFVSSQAVWKSTKDWIMKMGENKYLLYIDRKFGHTRLGFWRKLKWLKKDAETDNSEATKLSENIPLPATGEEAMKRLLACKGKDPYSILGVSVTCSDEEIKRYYRRQAFLVHPDKNQQPGAEEAFKILQHAFDLIGEPERREAYERRTMESEATWSELSQLLTQLHDKMEFAANTIRCTNCGRRHKRVLTDRPCYAARYCAQCKIRHSAKEGDIWAESSMMGLLVMYYACIDGAVYQITQWASCQKKNLRQLRPDCHVVQYRIVLGNKSGADVTQPSPGHEPNLEEFLNNLYNKSGVSQHSAPPKQSTPDTGDAKKRRGRRVTTYYGGRRISEAY